MAVTYERKRASYSSEMNTKYGCAVCADKEDCSRHFCKYANILDNFNNYKEYDKKMQEICPVLSSGNQYAAHTKRRHRTDGEA